MIFERTDFRKKYEKSTSLKSFAKKERKADLLECVEKLYTNILFPPFHVKS